VPVPGWRPDNAAQAAARSAIRGGVDRGGVSVDRCCCHRSPAPRPHQYSGYFILLIKRITIENVSKKILLAAFL
jgi:hypothetical protein